MMLLPLSAAMAAQSPSLVPFEVGGGYLNFSSDNGHWATYKEPSGEGEAMPDPVGHIVDLQTGKTIDLVDPSLSETDGVECYDITNDGKLVVGCLNNKPAYYQDGKWTVLKTGDPVVDRLYTGAVKSVSTDGSWMCGWMYADFNTLVGYIWHDGQRVELTNLPGYPDMLAKGVISAQDVPADPDKKPNIIFTEISADGTKVLAGIDHNHYGWGASWIIYDIPSQTYKWLLDETIRDGSFVNQATMSNNGLWCTGAAYIYDQTGDVNLISWRYDVKNDKFEKFSAKQDVDILATTIADDGTIFATSPANSAQRMVSIRSEGLWIDLATLLYQNYGINILNETGYDTTGYVTTASSDLHTIIAQAEHRSSAFALTLPVTFAEAAKGVNMLSEWAVSPVDGASFSAITDVRFYLSYPSEPTGTMPYILKDNEKIAEAQKVTAAGSTGKIFTLSFGNVEMEPGVKYEVVVPEGTFKIPDSSMTNPQASFSYVGRAAEPVKVLSTLPAPGSSINELSQTSKITLTFDADLAISRDAAAYLYDSESNQPLAALSIIVDGSSVSLASPASRKLNKGREYDVRITAGSLTDLMGLNGNEEIVINYSGAYIPEYKPGNFIFEESFDEPTTSLERFLLFEGDHNNPVSSMESLGFDSDNTPWNFSVRDADDYNYCAASHSDYSPAGASDDWMVTSRILIPNKYCNLMFDAQSSSANSGNRLQVYVWESDDTYGSLDRQVMEKMRAEAVCIFNEEIPEGLVDDELAGHWNDFSLPLSQFDGKSVYIAFVNANTTPGMLFIDNVKVESDGNFEIGAMMDDKVVGLESMPVKGFVKLKSVTPESVLVSFEGGGVSESREIDTRGLDKGAIVEFTFDKPMPLNKGDYTDYTITGTIESELQITSGRIANLEFEPHKRVLVEEGTGAWCGNCPRGILALEYAERMFPDHVVPIAIHNGDTYTYDQYTTFNELAGYPSARINRGEPANPMTADYEFISDGVETWADVISKEMEIPTLGEIEIDKVICHTLDNALSVDFSSRFALNLKDVDYNVFVCLLEDNLPGRQQNYLSGVTAPNIGTWGDEAKAVEIDYIDVARQVFDEQYMGINGLIPHDLNAGEVYTGRAVTRLYGNVKDMSNLKTVAAIINAANGEVINVARFSGCEFVNDSGIDKVEANSPIKITVIDGQIFADGSSENLEIWSISGMRVNNTHLTPGIYIVHLSDNTISKVIVR